MSDVLDETLRSIFERNSAFYTQRGFERRVGYGRKPALVVIDMANGLDEAGHALHLRRHGQHHPGQPGPAYCVSRQGTAGRLHHDGL